MAESGEVKFVSGHRLRNKVRVSGIGSDIDFAAIERAERALEALSANFDEWADAEIARLIAAREATRENGCTGEFAEELFRVAHDLKGQAVTLHYPLVTLVGASLCRLLEALAESESVPEELIDLHIDAARAIIRDRIHGEDNKVASNVVNQLTAATDAFIDSRAA